jgi:hypothetical protein
MSSIYGSITNETLAQVGASFVQSNRDRYAFTQFPMCRVLGAGNGHGTTVYSLPAIDNFLAKTASLADWGYGLARRASRDLGKASVTVAPGVYDIQPLTRPLTSNSSSEQVFADLLNNIIPGQLSMLYQGMELQLATKLTNGALATAKTFTDTGALDSYMSNFDHDPIGQILALIETSGLRWKKEVINGELVMCISPRVLDLFQRHPAFNGSGKWSGVAQVVPRQVVIDHLNATLMLDRTITFSAVADSVRPGQDSTPLIAGRNVLAFQVLDRTMSRDLAANPFDTPEGSVCLFEAEAPNVSIAEDLDTKVVKFNGDAEYQWGTPRGATWGIYFAASEMFT